jgi:potassium-transporting ATPase KdpC subunit
MSTRSTVRTHVVALRALLVMTVLTGIAYPLLVGGVAQVALPNQANGSLVEVDGEVVGSSLIGQSFTDADGVALPEWFQSRPSAAGDGYDGSASSGSNLGPENDVLIASVEARREAIEELDGADAATADALTASASGLDPHITPEYALAQVDRVADARGLGADEVRTLVEAHTQGRDLGFIGEPTVNVLELNLALAELG